MRAPPGDRRLTEDMNFLPKRDVLSLEELDRLCSVFIALGTRKLRITGGEPLVRRDIMILFRSQSRHLASGVLDELTLTTDGSQLERHAAELADCGVRRVNVSLDTLDAKKFRAITRWGDLDKVLAGIDAAERAGLDIKLNAVALRGFNDREAGDMIAWAHGRGFDITFIEVMPLGEIAAQRVDQFLPLSQVRAALSHRFTLQPSLHASGGPARYFITPLTHNFCESCNGVRVTCTGTLYMCLGQEDAVDLRGPLRRSAGDDLVNAAIRAAIQRKPRGHDFVINRATRHAAIARHMSVTGG